MVAELMAELRVRDGATHCIQHGCDNAERIARHKEQNTIGRAIVRFPSPRLMTTRIVRQPEPRVRWCSLFARPAQVQPYTNPVQLVARPSRLKSRA